MDLSNILKKYQETKKSRQHKEQQQQADDFYSVQGTDKENVNLSAIVSKNLTGARALPATQQVYDGCVAAVRALYASPRDAGSRRDDELIKAAERVMEAVEGDPAELIKLILTDYTEAHDFLILHAANTGIIAMVLAAACGLNHSGCLNAGMAGFLHDLGLTEFPGIVNKRDTLTEEEFKRITEHPAKGYDLLSAMNTTLSRQVLEAVYQEHERLDGSGYPRGLKGSAVSEYARIVAVSDVYESLTHWRPYRKAMTASDAVKVLLDEKMKYESRILKAVIEEIGIFPPGVLVQLNTKEVALVVKTRPGTPFKPVVTILFDAAGKKLNEPRQIDLSAHTVVYVEECVSMSAALRDRSVHQGPK